MGVVLAVLPACGLNGLSFRVDDRLDIVAPHDRDEISLPLTVKWSVRDFAVGPGAGSFGLLLDQAPPRPGKTLAWLYRGDTRCRGETGRRLCETATFLAGRGAFATGDTQFTFNLVPRLTGDDRRRQFHEVTVILLDAEGRRVGEGAWSVQFELRRQR